MLLLDVGNTRIKWGRYRRRKISAYAAAAHAGRPLAEVLTESWHGMPSPERIVAANVAGAAAAEVLNRYCQKHFKLLPEYVIPVAQACGITNGYRSPAQLGADRWATIIGAYHRCGGPVCAIGCGTAITVDTVTQTGHYPGGLIAPGISAMHAALAGATVAIANEKGEQVTLYGEDTRTAVTSGIAYAAAGLIERAVADIRAQHGAQTRVLLTGGDAGYLQSVLHEHYILAPHLVLEGLAVWAGQRS